MHVSCNHWDVAGSDCALDSISKIQFDQIDTHAPFSVVFNDQGLWWVGTIVSIGAITGTITADLVMLMGQARIHMVLAREKFIPSCLAKVHPTLKTPLNATMFTMVTAGIPALLLDISIIANMVSMGILTTMALMYAGVIYQTYQKDEASNSPLVIRLALLVVVSILEGLSSAYEWGLIVTCILLGKFLCGELLLDINCKGLLVMFASHIPYFL
ncbi:hypothetical protein BSKO_08263 [Bryopsis sp. KO-2023]|nr:hypothetical protein BSKO_08263 [Bryopsis sp. KO-2023]